ncbi:restriction endonuclease subunit S [Aliivibrio fischeri]|uniref:restriction endonuclease subunit S n=1 Tax=Aliivibrio fischeri TaxID=668 RepID=UPI0037356115
MSVERLITDNIDVWTSTVKTKSASGRGSSKKIELYGIKKLRELILELAVRGKLVPQDPNDEPASVLLERIAEEKALLVKDKIIPRTKALAPLLDEDIPNDLPEGWSMVRLGNLTSKLGSGSTPRGGKNVYTTEGVPFLRSQNIRNEGIKLDDIAYIPVEVHQKMDKTKVMPNDVLLNITGASLGRSTIFPESLCEANVSQHVTIIRLVERKMSLFVHLGILSPMVQRLVWGRQVGMAIEGLSKKVLEMFEFPVPPLLEQHRIVAKVDELMSLCDQLEQQTETSIEAHQTLVEVLLNTLTSSADAQELTQNWQRISEHFDTLFTTEKSIDTLKQTILQLAVMGKLVPQDPNDEPAAKLLERIAEEKAQLIKDKKIKKQKALPEITDDEKSFELPNGWEWERIGNLSHFIEYGSSQKTVERLPNGVPVLKMGDIQNGKLILGEHKVMSSDVDELPNLYVKNNDVLYNRTNSAELVGKTGIFKGVDDRYSFASYLIRIRCNQESIFPDYLNLSMNTPQFRISQIEPHIKKQCGQANVNGTLMKSMLVSLPPLKEQKRIFNKVNELIMMCDQLQASLKESQTTQLHLTDAIIDKAL